MLACVPRPVRSVHQKNVRPPIVVVVNKRDAWPERLRQKFLSKRPVVVYKSNPSLLCHIKKCHSRQIRQGWRRRARSSKRGKKQNNRQPRQTRHQLPHCATAFPSRPTPRASATRLM